jgi:hypothetical protein
MFTIFSLLCLLNIEKFNPSSNSLTFSKYFYQHKLLNNLSSQELSAYQKLKSIREYEDIFDNDTRVINLWKNLDLDF